MINKDDIQVPKHGYANLTNDYMFKKIFGSEECKDILITFLNHIIGDKVIKDVTFITNEHLGPTMEDRKAIFDINCSTMEGEEFIVEMQNRPQTYFRDRALFYSCYPIINQAQVAKQKYYEEHGNTAGFCWNYRLKPVRLIAILSFPMTHNTGWPEEKCHSSYRIREDTTGEMLHDRLQFIFLELARFNKTEDNLETPYDKWMFLFKNMPLLKSRPKAFDNADFDRLFKISEFANFAPEEFRKYQKSEEMIYDYQNTIDFAEQKGFDKGLEEGLKEGLEKGREDATREIALRLYSLGMSKEQVAQATGLSDDLLNEILSNR